MGASPKDNLLQIPIILILFAALFSGPKMVIYGLMAVFNIVNPIPVIKSASKNNGKLCHFAAGIMTSMPMHINRKANIIDFLYPIDSRILPEGTPKRTNAENVAVVTK